MRKGWYILLLVIMPWISSAQDIAPSNSNTIEWMPKYYVQPDGSALNDHLHALKTDPFLQYKLPAVAGVLYGLTRNGKITASDLQRYAQEIPEIMPASVFAASVLFPHDEQWFQTIERSQPNQKSKIRDIRKIAPTSIDQIDVLEGAWAIDFQWGVYFATGAPTAIAPFLQAARQWNPEKSDDDHGILQTTIVWTLQQIAASDEHLRQLIDNNLQQNPCTSAACTILENIAKGQHAMSQDMIERRIQSYVEWQQRIK